ncbi:hypothetical protein U1Q18_011230 [Sarracenia purpurea var. burkii]
MAKTKKAKKPTLTKKQPEINKLEKKILKRKKKKVRIVPEKVDSDNDSSSSEPDSDKIQNLLEPYTKDQLIDFIIDAAVKDDALLARIRDAADRTVSHRKIFVYGLGWDTTRETVVSAYESYGEIEDCKVVSDYYTGKAKGYGFVVFKTRKGAIKALKQPQKKIGNRITSCQLASLGSVPPPQSHDTSGRKIYVSNVQADVDRERLRAFFEKFGEIETGPLGFDMYTGKSRGFALFVYKTQEAARKALEEPHKMFEGNQLHCKRAAEGKSKVGGEASVKTVVQPVQAPMLAAFAAAQNLALYQHPSLNPMYNGFFANPNAGLIAGGSVNPMVAAGSGGLGQGVLGSSSFGGTASVLGTYGSDATALQGLQHTYPSSQSGQMSSALAPGSSGSFNGYPSYM